MTLHTGLELLCAFTIAVCLMALCSGCAHMPDPDTMYRKRLADAACAYVEMYEGMPDLNDTDREQVAYYRAQCQEVFK